ncbi:MAG: PEP-CTERM sorting domain-containing protein [Microcystis flos-aquae DF17]|nr:MAG: PEP-CTERM sorting domain-containing protein [Microcystis flos-aquae DF17]
MIANISRQLATGTVAIAASVAALSFAGAAPAQAMMGTLSITGDATIDPWGTTDPMLKPLSVTVVNSATGQFAGVTAGNISVPKSFALTGNPGMMPMHMFGSPASITDFISILVNQAPPTGPGVGTVLGSITSSMAMGSFAGVPGASTTSYTVTGSMIFDEPNGAPDLLGTFNISFTRSENAGQVSQGYTLSLQKSSAITKTPEPAAILGILAVAGVGAFARRKS